MRRRTACSLVPLGFLLFPAVLLAQVPDIQEHGNPKNLQRARAKKIALLRNTLTIPITFPLPGDEDYIDQKTTAGELLDLFADRYEITFTVDEAAFKTAGGKGFRVLEQKVLEKAFPKMKRVSLGSVLQQILSRVSLANNDYATFSIRPDGIEITTNQARNARVWGEDYGGPKWPVVNLQVERRPLSQALDDLLTNNVIGAFSIVQNPRAARQLKTPVTATLRDAPLDTTVEILADLAGLRAVVKENVLYVTTPENTPRPERPQDTRASPTAELPSISLFLEGRPLGSVLEELAVDPGFNIVQDPRACRQLKTRLRANLQETHLSTAADVLADMAGLSAVLKDNVLYVTTPENAQRLKQQQKQNRSFSARPILPNDD
jgi:hypothetical protein